MAFEVVMPRLGWNMEEGALATWRKRDGDPVEAGEILFEVESDKAVQEVEALESGILRLSPGSPPLGKQVPVGTILAYIVKPGESVPYHDGPVDATPTSVPTAVSVLSPPIPSEQAETPQPSGAERPRISPRAVRVASELDVDPARLKGSGHTGRIVERDVRQAAALLEAGETPRAKILVTPVARQVAEELGVDLAQLAPQMQSKRITRVDVETAAKKLVGTTSVAPTAKGSEVPLPAGAATPISQVRRKTAERMAASMHTAAPVTLNTEVDATELILMRNQLKGDGVEPIPSYNDLLSKLVARALLEHPQVNARFEEDGIVQNTTVNIGIAVDTERGLLVPVLRDVQTKSLRQIAQESAARVERARTGRVSPDELTGGTFTITNLGMYEIDAFTPIINLPECAILGVGRIVPKQIVVDADAARVAIRHMMTLSLTFDHRLVDGAPAARFLQRVKQYVEKPYLWLLN